MDDYMELYNKTKSWLGRCPQCQNPALFNCGINRNDVACPICGYTYNFEILWDHSSQQRKLTNLNRSMIHFVEKKGFGVMWVERDREFPGDFRCLNKAITPNTIYKFKEQLLFNGVDAEKSYLTSWDEETKTVKTVLGKVYDPFGNDIIEEDEYWDQGEFPSRFSFRNSENLY